MIWSAKKMKLRLRMRRLRMRASAQRQASFVLCDLCASPHRLSLRVTLGSPLRISVALSHRSATARAQHVEVHRQIHSRVVR